MKKQPDAPVQGATKEQLRAAMDAAVSEEELDAIWKVMAEVGYSPEGMLGQRLRERKQEIANG